MKKIAQFFKVSEKEFLKNGTPRQFANIILPKRATRGSAGYDFFLTDDLCLDPGQTVKIATGVRVKIEEGWVLKIYPRSSLGFKYRLTMDNTVGIIDSDYFNAENEGHIFIKMTNCGQSRLSLTAGTAFAQGVFNEYGITVDDCCDAERTGGLGSTDKN